MEMRDAGLSALEVYHSDHRPRDVEQYLALAREFDLGVTGGSDFPRGREAGSELGSGAGGNLQHPAVGAGAASRDPATSVVTAAAPSASRPEPGAAKLRAHVAQSDYFPQRRRERAEVFSPASAPFAVSLVSHAGAWVASIRRPTSIRLMCPRDRFALDDFLSDIAAFIEVSGRDSAAFPGAAWCRKCLAVAWPECSRRTKRTDSSVHWSERRQSDLPSERCEIRVAGRTDTRHDTSVPLQMRVGPPGESARPSRPALQWRTDLRHPSRSGFGSVFQGDVVGDDEFSRCWYSVWRSSGSTSRQKCGPAG